VYNNDGHARKRCGIFGGSANNTSSRGGNLRSAFGAKEESLMDMQTARRPAKPLSDRMWLDSTLNCPSQGSASGQANKGEGTRDAA
jgi:hypothetical protein